MVRPRLDKGLVHLITGDGPGKTTSALGLGMRAAGQGYRVYMIQFMKGTWNHEVYGEVKFLRSVRRFQVRQFGRGEFVEKRKPDKVDRDQAARGLKYAQKLIQRGRHDIVILDEILVALDYNLLSRRDVSALIKDRPRHVELILTGRDAPRQLHRLADYVIEIKEIKHPFRRGVLARKGVEY